MAIRVQAVSGCSILAIACAAPAMGQVASSNAQSDATPEGGITEIIVTARRAAETLQTTPVAVTALPAAALAEAQVADVADLQRSVPNLSVATGAPSASGFAFVAIRGQGSLNASVAVDPAVAIYIDDVYIARPSQALVDLNDLQRVEVLRGPQGTLFGRNTTGGALNIVSADPTGEFEASAKVEAGNYSYRSAGGLLNLPIDGDALALRMNYNFKKRDGYAFNTSLQRDANDLDSHFVRSKLRWAPGDGDWSATFSGDFSRQTDSGQMVALGGVNTTTSALPPALRTALLGFLHDKDDWYRTAGTGFSGDTTQPFDLTKAYGFAGTVQGRLGEIGFKSVSAYRYSNAVGYIDLDATPVALIATRSGYLSKAYSQELQFSGDPTPQLSWIAGAYGSQEKGNEYSLSEVFGFAGQPVSLNDGDVKNVTAAVFTQANYGFTDRLRATAGVRWTWDKRDVELHNVRNVAFAPTATLPNGLDNCAIVRDVPGGACDQTERATFDYPAWTVGLDYQLTDELFVYAKTSGAAKAGGWNLRIGSVPAFAPEKVHDAEVGAKTSWLDNRLQVNLAVFDSWLKDTQRVVAAVIGGTSTAYLVNAGDANIYGAELEFIAQPWTGMELRGSVALLDGAYDDGTFTETQLAGGVPVVVDRSDEPLLQLPERQFNFGATQTILTGVGDLTLHADYAYVASQYFYTSTLAAGSAPAAIAQNDVSNRLGRIPGYGLVNARIALAIEGTGLEVAAFGRNLADRQYLTRSFANLYATPVGIENQYVGDPLTWGVSVSYRFD